MFYVFLMDNCGTLIRSQASQSDIYVHYIVRMIGNMLPDNDKKLNFSPSLAENDRTGL